MPEPKAGYSRTGKPMHYSVGAFITDDHGRHLMLDRVKVPFGWACPAGHVDDGEDPETAIRREVFEETGLTVTAVRLLYAKEVAGNVCSRGITYHHWCVYDCETTGTPRFDPEEAKGMRWVSPDELPMLTLEPIWKYWFVRHGDLPQ
jgi:8-oxo-dGTP diphosphatase